MKLAVRASLLAFPFAGSLLAQQPATQWRLNQRQGIQSTGPLGLFLNNTTSSDDVLIRSAGPSTGVPGPWSTQRFGPAGDRFPEFTTAELLLGINRGNTTAGVTVTDLDFGGVSTGGDVKPAIDQGGIMDPDNLWHFLSVVVAPKASGSYGVPGSTLNSLTSPVGTVLSYYIEGSVGIDSSLEHSTVVEQTPAQVGIVGAAANQVAGIDWGMGVIATDPDPNGARTHPIAPVRDRIYFSFTKGWKTANSPFRFLNASGNNEAPNTAAIYVMNWVPMDGGTWGWDNFREAYSAVELFGTNHSNIEIDAISVFARTEDALNPGTYLVNRVVLSTTLASGSADQLLGYDSENFPATIAQPLKTESGQLISEQLGLKGDGNGNGNGTDLDDVTGTCGSDPEAGSLTGSLGIAIKPHETSPSGISKGISLYRGIETTTDATSLDQVHIQMSGLTPTGNSGFVAFWYGIPVPNGSSKVSVPIDGWVLLDVVPVGIQDSTCDADFPGDFPSMGPVHFRGDFWTSPTSGPTDISLITAFEY